MNKEPEVAIIDYGLGNLLSVSRAVEQCGGKPILSSDVRVISKADCMILPGVGAFRDGMRSLQKLDLVDAIRDAAGGGIPILGICLGMQLLLESSEEKGLTEGLGIISGRVVSLPIVSGVGRRIKVPHVGWASIYPTKEASGWHDTLLEGLTPGNALYFVHSYMAKLADPALEIAYCKYEDIKISAMIGQNNVFGCQFHPEKSGTLGLKIIQDFIRNA